MIDEAVLDEYRDIVISIARSAVRSSPTIDVSDLCQVGELAVLRAVRTYNPAYGTKITSYVRRLVKQAVYNEAARFLGVFTVDHKTTEVAARVHRMAESGKTDTEIAIALSQHFSRDYDTDHVRDLRLAYSRRNLKPVSNDVCGEEDIQSIQELLSNIPKSNDEEFILQNHILGHMVADDVAQALDISRGHMYRLEKQLTERIEEAITNG